MDEKFIKLEKLFGKTDLELKKRYEIMITYREQLQWNSIFKKYEETLSSDAKRKIGNKLFKLFEEFNSDKEYTKNNEGNFFDIIDNSSLFIDITKNKLHFFKCSVRNINKIDNISENELEMIVAQINNILFEIEDKYHKDRDFFNKNRYVAMKYLSVAYGKMILIDELSNRIKLDPLARYALSFAPKPKKKEYSENDKNYMHYMAYYGFKDYLDINKNKIDCLLGNRQLEIFSISSRNKIDEMLNYIFNIIKEVIKLESGTNVSEVTDFFSDVSQEEKELDIDNELL